MGGTTAKICLIDGGTPQTARRLEIARVYRFLGGSGIPLRIPVIEMVEIGAGGGSIAHVDALGRIAVGPESAGSDPGPACYGLGGTRATVTDADVVLGRIDPERFAGGSILLERGRAETALLADVGDELGLEVGAAGLGVSEMVDENMANAARVHAIESGKVVEARTLVAFGGAAPLHAARLAEKLGMRRIVVPPGAGVGSAIGFLRAPVAFEVSRSHYQRLSALDIDGLNDMLADMRDEARAVVAAGSGGRELTETGTTFMRYLGQGHEVAVGLPLGGDPPAFGADATERLRVAFEREYRRLYGRTIPDLDVEILNWGLRVRSDPEPSAAVAPESAPVVTPPPGGRRLLIDSDSGEAITVPVYAREQLQPGAQLAGPAVIVEDDTATLVTARFGARIHPDGAIVLERKER